MLATVLPQDLNKYQTGILSLKKPVRHYKSVVLSETSHQGYNLWKEKNPQLFYFYCLFLIISYTKLLSDISRKDLPHKVLGDWKMEIPQLKLS